MLPLILPVVAGGIGYVKGLFASDDDENNSGATGTGKVVVYGLAAVGAYTVFKGAKRVIDKGSG